MISKIRFKITTILFLTVISFQNICAQDIVSKFTKVQELGGIEEYLYKPNGMNILLVQDKTAAVLTVQIVYHVGSKHEVMGNTGSTHLLEHLNFKATPTFNKKNGNAIFIALQGIRARMNTTTWYNRTNYYETIPSDKIERALHIESDRMRNSLLLKEDKDAEMTVVRNEFERGENNPNKLLSKEIWATAYMANPYHHNTIGWCSDIENMPIEVLRKFYNTYYWPDDATLTIIGDFQKDSLFTLIDKYFGKITKAPHEMPQPYTTEPEQLGPRKITIKKPGQQGIVTIGYKIPGKLHSDFAALNILSEIIGSGTSSVIYKTYIDEGIAVFGSADASKLKEVGLFSVVLGFTPDKNHQDINSQMLVMIEKIKNEGVQQVDVDRIIAKLNAKTILSRDGSGSIAAQLTEAIAGGDWKDYITGPERLSTVTAKDVNRVANIYLNEDQSTTGYFIPQIPGENPKIGEDPVNFTDNNSKYFYRSTDLGEVCLDSDSQNMSFCHPRTEITLVYETIEVSEKGEKFERKKVAGIDVITAKTGVKDFLTVSASFPIENYLNTTGNETVPGLTAQMLIKGTIKNDKFKFSEKLEKLRVSIKVSASKYTVNIGFTCLKQDVTTVMNLLSEELRYPLFDSKEFTLLKAQNINNLKQGLVDPGTQASIALVQAMYPLGHPNYEASIQETIKNIEAVMVKDLQDFHKTYFGPAGMHLVAVGDIDTKQIYAAINSSFNRWKGGVTTKAIFTDLNKTEASVKTITIPKKPSAQMYVGHYTGIERNDKDFIPFYVGANILGGGFSGRLMQTVRDRDGLTYGINANHSGYANTGGYLKIGATFNPSLFQKGLDATMVELKNWLNNGITEEELAVNKTNLQGSFKVGLSTTSSLAGTLLSFVERGLDPSYLDQYPKDIEAVTLDQVNTVIKKYIDLDKLIIIKSGSFDENGEPLK